MKKILVTGGAGFIGSYIVLYLVKKRYEPVIVDNFSNSSLARVLELEKIIKRKLIYYKLDLKNKSKLRTVFNKQKIDAVIHCAGFKDISESRDLPLLYFNNNIKATLSLVDCMIEKKVFNLIFSSTAAVYDLNKKKIRFTETSKVGNTNSPYATSKYIIEKILIDLAKYNSRWKILIFRYFNPVGELFYNSLSERTLKSKNNNKSLFENIFQIINKKNIFLKIYGNKNKNFSSERMGNFKQHLFYTKIL